MATQTVEFGAPTGRTITAKIFAVGSDTVVESVTATEATNRLGTYTADFTDAAAGVYKIVAFDSVITPPLATWWVDLTLTTATFYAYEMPVSVIQSGLATPTNITAATGIVLSGVTHTGAIIPTVSTVTDGAKSLTALSTVTWTPTIAGYIDVAVSSRNAVTPPTVAEFNARTILAAAYFDPAVDTVARVTLVDTTTTNTDMRGTDGANTTAPATPANVSAVTTTLAALLPAALVGGRIDASVGAVATDAINAAAIAADAVTEIQDGLATQTSLDAKLTAARLGALTSLDAMIVANVYTTDSMANVALAAGGDATAANQDLLLARLATGPIRITSTVTAGGVVNLRVGDDYVGTRIAITFDDAGGTIMTYMQSASVASVIFGAGRNTEINEIYGTVDPDDGVYDSGAGTSTVYPQIARADITGPVSDDYGYQIKAIDTAGRHITKIAGSVVVLAKNAFPV